MITPERLAERILDVSGSGLRYYQGEHKRAIIEEAEKIIQEVRNGKEPRHNNT